MGVFENKLSNGNVYYTVELYAADSGSVKCNVMADNRSVMDKLIQLKQFNPITVVFVLRPVEKMYKLAIDNVLS